MNIAGLFRTLSNGCIGYYSLHEHVCVCEERAHGHI